MPGDDSAEYSAEYSAEWLNGCHSARRGSGSVPYQYQHTYWSAGIAGAGTEVAIVIVKFHGIVPGYPGRFVEFHGVGVSGDHPIPWHPILIRSSMYGIILDH